MAATQKNFVVKNGIEIATDLIYATNDSDKVGFGTTLPTSKVDVIGDLTAYGTIKADGGPIIATHNISGSSANFSGITTVGSNFNVGTGGTALKVIVGSSSSIGVNTSLPAYPLDVYSSASIGQTAAHFYGDLIVTGNVTGNSFDGQVTVGGTLSFTDLSVTGILTASDEEVYKQFDIINNGSAAYQYQSTGIGFTVNRDDPPIFLIRGQNYRFNVNATGYPFYIKTAPTTGTGNRFDHGVQNNGAQVGIITFRVPFDAPRTLYYQASNQAGMGSTIYVLKEAEPLPTGISTTQLVVQNINATGVSTLTNLNVVNATVTGIATVADFANLITSGNLNVAGVSTLTGSVRVGSAVTINSNGINVTGVGTFTDSIKVGSAITVNSTGINVVGIVTATSFTGSGSGITGLTNSNLSGTAGITNANLANSTISGVALGSSLNTLTMNTSGTGLSGSTTYNGSGASTFTVTSNATSANTASAIVARDASGNFIAGTITASLNGTASNANTLDSIDSTSFLRSDAADQKTSGNLRFNDSIQLNFGTGDDAEMFCDGSNLYLDLNSSGVTSWIVRDGTTNKFTFARSTGTFTATGDISSSSDVRLKTNIKTLTNSLEKILSIRGVEYDRIDLDGKHQIGVIAQEIEEIAPELVSEDENGFKSVSYGNITALLIEAVKELSAKVKELESKIS